MQVSRKVTASSCVKQFTSASGESASWREERERKRKNSLPKVLSTADRLIHFRINRFDQPGSHSGSLRRRSFSTISLLRRLVSVARTLSVSSSLRFLGGINNFYRPSGRRNGKRQWAFNLLRVWRVLRGFPRRKCKDGATYRNATLLLLWRYGDADENRTTAPSNFGFDGGSARCRN